LPDPRNRLGRQRRRMRLMNIEKLPAHVRPAGGLRDESLVVNAVESGVAVGLQCAAETAQVLVRMFALAIW